MRFVLIIFLFFSIGTRAQNSSDTLTYSGGFNSLGKNLLKFLGDYDLAVTTSTFYIADVDFDDNCKIAGITLFVTGDTNFNSLIIRAIASTERNWSSTRSHSWRLSLPIYLFKEDESGWHPKAPSLGNQYAVFKNRYSADGYIKLPPIEIKLSPPERRTVILNNRVL